MAQNKHIVAVYKDGPHKGVKRLIPKAWLNHPILGASYKLPPSNRALADQAARVEADGINDALAADAQTRGIDDTPETPATSGRTADTSAPTRKTPRSGASPKE